MSRIRSLRSRDLQDARDPVLALYRGVLVLGVAGLVILALGLAEFFAFEPPGQRTGLSATVGGVYQYDPQIRQTAGGDRRAFARSELFAAVVDWAGLPEDQRFGARWFDSFQAPAGGVGPAPPSSLPSVVPVKLPEGMKANFPGGYLFVVERYSGGRPVEVIARRQVVVEAS